MTVKPLFTRLVRAAADADVTAPHNPFRFISPVPVGITPLLSKSISRLSTIADVIEEQETQSVLYADVQSLRLVT